MALISQSTQPPWKFERLAALMVSRAHELKIVNTVCPVTIRRQQDTLEAAREVDLMVVVGGRSSANTKELTRLCEIAGTRAIQVEGVRDLEDPSVFDAARIVGVTGGTSTPIEDLRDVAERIPDPRRDAEGQEDRRRACPRGARARGDAGRSHHLPHRTTRGRPSSPARPRPRGEHQGRHPGRRDRGTAERRQEHALQPLPRAALGDRRGSRPDHARSGRTATPNGTDAASSSSTPAASSCRPTTRSRRASRSRPASRSPRRTSSCSSSMRSAGSRRRTSKPPPSCAGPPRR